MMDTIETPKIDRSHRLGAVSLTVRAAWGARRWGQLAGGTVLPPLSWQTLSFSLPAIPPKGPCSIPGARAPNACSERLQGLMHGGLVGYVVFAAGCKTADTLVWCAELIRLSRGQQGNLKPAPALWWQG